MQIRFLPIGLRHVIAAAILSLYLASTALAQTQTHYVTLTYMKTLPGKAAEFRKFAETEMTKMGQMGVEEGVLDAYYVLRLTAPYVTGSDYDYATVVWYKKAPSLAPLDMKLWDARAKKAGYASYQQYLDKRDSLAKTVRSAWRSSTARSGQVHAGNYIRTVSYQVDPEYRPVMVRFLEEYTAPLAQAQIREGARAVGWGVSRPAGVTGSNDEAGYSFAVSNVFKDSDAMMSGPNALTEEAFKKALPGKSYATYMNELNVLNQHRKSVSTRIQEVVSLVGTPPEIKP